MTTNSPEIIDDDQNGGPFEGPEKLLEIWFTNSADDIPNNNGSDNVHVKGLRKVDRNTWQDMLNLVNCQILSVIHGKYSDAYLLSFVYFIYIVIIILALMILISL